MVRAALEGFGSFLVKLPLTAPVVALSASVTKFELAGTEAVFVEVMRSGCETAKPASEKSSIALFVDCAGRPRIRVPAAGLRYLPPTRVRWWRAKPALLMRAVSSGGGSFSHSGEPSSLLVAY